MKNVLTIIGTRPEAIKLKPVLHVLSKHKKFKSQVCITQQHTDLLLPLLLLLDIEADYILDIPKKDNNLRHISMHILNHIGNLLLKIKPDLVIVQGDTTTAFMGALASYYAKIPVAHIEAGLRTHNLLSPWPEEGHRRLIDQLTSYFFAPTEQAFKALQNEGIPSDKIWIVGNTAIDALRLLPKSIKSEREETLKTILVTIHRRENHGKVLDQICQALMCLANLYTDIKIIFFLHPNPAIHVPIKKKLNNIENIELKHPVDHFSFINLLRDCTFIISDSGGIQEEAPFLGKPILIPRNTTERPEGIYAGTARVVGTQTNDIINACKELLECPEVLLKMSKVHYPYGDGYAAERIVNILVRELYG